LKVDPVFAIVIETTTELQREQVQATVKANATSWWHGMADLWFVRGKSARAWRDLVGPIFPTASTGKVVVFKVDNQSPGSNWAYRARFPASTKKWIQENL
jgi:hypothetical protein